jgi:RNA polymerase sigma factor (sigma-70 family)
MDSGERLRWFAREVLPHEADVRRWLGARIRRVPHCDVDEIVQEAYARLWATGSERIVNPRAYFFVTARHVVGEILRRARVVSIETMADIDTLNIPDGDGGPERRVSGSEEVQRMRHALAKLPAKCRQAFELRKFEGLSQREIAERMGISQSTVEKHLIKALRGVVSEMKKDERGPEEPSRLSRIARGHVFRKG